MPSFIKRTHAKINTTSMADIAFLLLVFFLVTTTIANDKGLVMQLPADPKDQPFVPRHEREIFNILINANDEFLANGKEILNASDIREMIKLHIMNYGASKELSTNPKKAIVSIQASRNTSYDSFIAVFNEAQGAYYDIYAERAGVTNKRWREISSNTANPKNRIIYTNAREGIPMNLSIAEPNRAVIN